MNATAPMLSYPFDKAPPHGEIVEIAPGIFWLRMPLPFALDHINLWLIEDHDGFTLIDTGIGTDACVVHWYRLFSGILRIKPIKRILVTHHHPDHVGLAHWLATETGAPVLMSRTEWLLANFLNTHAATDRDLVDEMVAFYRAAAAPSDFVAHIMAKGPDFAPLVRSIPRKIIRLLEDDIVDIGGWAWRVIIGEGHAPEHVCLYSKDRGILISGDQVLPRISPNIGVEAWEPMDNPLKSYLRSIEKLQQLPEGILTLPSHGLPFYGLHHRIEQLAKHHAERLTSLLVFCDEGRTLMDLTSLLFPRPLDLHQMSFAIGEALSHVRYLEEDGALSRSRVGDHPPVFSRARSC